MSEQGNFTRPPLPGAEDAYTAGPAPAEADSAPGANEAPREVEVEQRPDHEQDVPDTAAPPPGPQAAPARPAQDDGDGDEFDDLFEAGGTSEEDGPNLSYEDNGEGAAQREDEAESYVEGPDLIPPVAGPAASSWLARVRGLPPGPAKWGLGLGALFLVAGLLTWLRSGDEPDRRPAPITATSTAPTRPATTHTAPQAPALADALQRAEYELEAQRALVGRLQEALTAGQSRDKALLGRLERIEQTMAAIQAANRAQARSRAANLAARRATFEASPPAATDHRLLSVLGTVAWVQDPDGAVALVRPGDTLDGVGRVLAMDSGAGALLTEAGSLYLPGRQAPPAMAPEE